MSAAPRAPGLVRRLLSESAVYGLGGIANQSLTIVLVPIYARHLQASGFGTVALINATLSLSQLLAALALPQAFFRSYLKESTQRTDRQHVLETAWALRMVVSIVFLGLFSVAAIPLTALIFGDPADLPLLLLIGPIVLFDSLNLIPLSFLRAERQPRTFAAISFMRAVLGSVLIIWLVVIVDLGPLGVVLGSGISALAAATTGTAVLLRKTRIRPRWDPRLVRHMLAFSLPLVPASLASWGLNLSDRYIVNSVVGTTAVGVYSSGYTAGLVINALAIAPFTLAWGAAYWEIGRGDDAPIVFRRVLSLFSVGAAGVALLLGALGTDVIRIMLTPAFEDGRFVVPFSAFAFVLYGIYTIVTTGLNLTSHTRWLAATMAAAFATNLVLNLTLVPLIGIMGAALATVLGYLFLAISSGIISQRFYPVPWDLPRAAGALGVAGGLTAAALLGPDTPVWRLACVLAYPPLVVLLGIVDRRDVASIMAVVRRRMA